MGVLPLSHMGHKIDLLPALQKLGGYSYVNLAPNKVFDIYTQTDVIAQQWEDPSIRFSCFNNVGDFLKMIFGHHVFDKINIVVGQDRVRWGERIVHGLKHNTFKELECDTDNIQAEIVVPPTYKQHSFSGTTMREAAAINDRDCFYAHMGPNISRTDSNFYCGKVAAAIYDGVIPIKRKTG